MIFSHVLDLRQKAHLSSHPVPPPSSAALLEKVGYDMSTHPAESADWLNVLFSQVSRKRSMGNLRVL